MKIAIAIIISAVTIYEIATLAITIVKRVKLNKQKEEEKEKDN